MIVKLFVFWILMSLFFGCRFAGKTVRVVLGVIAFFWAIRILAGVGIKLLPIILVILVFSKVIVPFVEAFLRHFQDTGKPAIRRPFPESHLITDNAGRKTGTGM